MGCDIHIAIEVLVDGSDWQEVQWQWAERYDGSDPVPGVAIAPDVFDSRNYNLFGILADVRNGTGFAGIQTGTGWPSIAPLRGLPLDVDPRMTDGEPRWLGDHSHTWVALDELKAFPWDSVVAVQYGVVPAAEYERMQAVGDTPTSYSGGVFGLGIETYEPADYKVAKRNGILAPKPFVRMSWHQSARSATCDWPGVVIPWLDELAAGRPLRLLIGFDS